MWICWMSGCRLGGAQAEIAQRRMGAPAAVPVKPTVVTPSSRAARSAPSMFGERPEVEMPKNTSPVRPTAHLAREQVLVAVVVADRGEHRGVGGQRDRGQRWRSKCSRDRIRRRGAARRRRCRRCRRTAACRRAAGALRDRLRDGERRRRELCVGGGALEHVARAAQMRGDDVLVGHPPGLGRGMRRRLGSRACGGVQARSRRCRRRRDRRHGRGHHALGGMSRMQR